MAPLALRRGAAHAKGDVDCRRREEDRARRSKGGAREFFIPYALLKPLQNVPPKPGTRWRANVYRMDYDGGKRSSWQWAPVSGTFHQFEKFGELVFAER